MKVLPFDQQLEKFKITEATDEQYISGLDVRRFDRKRVYEIPTEELFQILCGRIKALFPSGARILDFCAGTGWLAKELKRRLGSEYEIAACDDGSWKIKTEFKGKWFSSLEEATNLFRHDAIVACWIPCGYDPTPKFRSADNVRAYWLIGEGVDGCCGDESCFDNKIMKKDGWKMTQLATKQLCRTDYFIHGKFKGHSHTFEYLRK